MQDAPSQEERMFKDKTAVRKDTPIKGVRMGAGERSYLVRDNQIDVLKNMYGGVQVGLILLICSCCPAQNVGLVADTSGLSKSDAGRMMPSRPSASWGAWEAAVTLRDAPLSCNIPSAPGSRQLTGLRHSRGAAGDGDVLQHHAEEGRRLHAQQDADAGAGLQDVQRGH